jgi:predicted enzyme related to lactoylglutathione lyase
MNEGVIGITIWTEDLDRLVEFYSDTLGMSLRDRKSDWANFEWGELRLNLGTHDQVQGQAGDPYRMMISFGVTDIHGECHRLEGLGVEFLRQPEQEHWSGWVATFLDPDGNILQFLERPK